MVENKKNIARLDNPVPVRLGDLKPIYQREAVELEHSMHWLLLKALREYAKTFKKK